MTNATSSSLQNQKSKSSSFKRWRFGIVAALFVMVITFIPQLNLIVKRGADWQGSYALIDYDELTYSAQLHSLIEGKPRRNNPFLLEQKSDEDFLSIQFLPPYLMLLPSWILGISASSAFIFLMPIMAFFSSMAIFWLLFNVTKSELTASVGVLIVLLCGRLVSENPLIPHQAYGSFAFLRRYIPAVPFPLFFMFCVFVYRAYAPQTRRPYLWGFGAGIFFGSLVFSYFYLWTASVAWLSCFTLLWFWLRPEHRPRVAKSALVIVATSSLSLVPYFYMLSLRAKTTDTVQALTFGRAPDLLRLTELVGLIVLVMLAWLTRRGSLSRHSPELLFTASCALTPFVVFNQQILTGRSLQPFHYEQFIINYLVLIAVVCAYHAVWQRPKIRPFVWALFAIGVGITTAIKEARDYSALNVTRDQAEPVFQKLCELATKQTSYGYVVSNSTLLAASSLTSCSVPELWAPSLYTHGGTTINEQIERFYQYLFFLGVTPQALGRELQNSPQTRAALFGLHRENRAITTAFTPVSTVEIQQQVNAYSSYINGFTRDQAKQWPISYLLMIDDTPYNFSNLDKWYAREPELKVGGSFIYPVHFRNE